ncbi:MAG: nitroreductase [Deltaproteobacteria bacterium]|nr:nitroreductase [Deltaproteobacteria bacterium]
MELKEAIKKRKSIRAFREDPIPREILREILEYAINAPSAINLQPWEFIIVSGEERKRLSRKLLKAYREKKISCSPGNVKPLPEVFLRRGYDSFLSLNGYIKDMGKEFDEFINEGSCDFYGAPSAILICLDNAFSYRRFLDIGIVLGYILLLAQEFGLATCTIGLISAYEDEIREVLNIPESKKVAIAVAIGYPDMENPLNNFKTQRDEVDMFIRWVD